MLANDYLGQNPAGTITASDATSTQGGTVTVNADGKIIHLRIDEVSRFVAADDYVAVHANKTSYLVHVTLSDLEQRLDRKQFRRVHRSVIVNLDHVVSCEPVERRSLLKLRDGSELSTSRAGSQNLQDLIL